jgi:hypothetical protein
MAHNKQNENSLYYNMLFGTWGTILGWGTMLSARRSWVQIMMKSLDFFNVCNPSSRTMALGSTQPLTEMSTRNLPGGVKDGQHIRLATLMPSVSRLSRKMWEPRHLTTLWTFMACHGDSFTFYNMLFWLFIIKIKSKFSVKNPQNTDSWNQLQYQILAS